MEPALAVVGVPLTVIVTSAVEAVQGELLIVHRNTLTPVPRPVTFVVADVEFVIVPLPLTKLQLPVPVVGLLPVSVALVEHIA